MSCALTRSLWTAAPRWRRSKSRTKRTAVLNASKSNAILILHAFSGDAHAAGISPESGKPGWWDNMIGPGKAFDTEKYFVICSNVLGGCRGHHGSVLDQSGYRLPLCDVVPGDHDSRYGAAAEDADRAYRHRRLLAVAGGSMGGMQALEWAVSYPDAVVSAIPIAATARHTAQQIAFNEVGRQAIIADLDWNEGNYLWEETAGSRSGRGAHGRPYHVYERRFHAREVRPPAARQRQFRLRFRDRFRGGELSALSRQRIREPL